MQRTRTHRRLALKPDLNALSASLFSRVSFRETTRKCLLTLNILIVGGSVPLSHLPDAIMVVYIRPLRENAHPSAISRHGAAINRSFPS